MKVFKDKPAQSRQDGHPARCEECGSPYTIPYGVRRVETFTTAGSSATATTNVYCHRTESSPYEMLHVCSGGVD